MTSIRPNRPSLSPNRDRPLGAPKSVVVKRGDTLSKLARDHKTNVDAFLKANPQISNPDRIYAGQRLSVPPPTTAAPTAAPVSPVPSAPPPTPASPQTQLDTRSVAQGNEQLLREQLGITPGAAAPTPRTGLSDPAPATDARDGHTTVTVKPGDTLSGIARDNGVSLSDLVAANPQIKDPNLIHPGQPINLPSPPPSGADGQAGPDATPPAPAAEPPSTAPVDHDGHSHGAAEQDGPDAPSGQMYTVRSGDTLGGIASRHGTTTDQLLAHNPEITNPNLIHPGQSIRLPDGTTPQPSSPPGGSGGPVPPTPGASDLPTVQRATAYRRGEAIGEIELTRVDGKLVEKNTAAAFLKMEAAARADGVDLNIISGFRTMEQQRYLYDGWAKRKPGFNLAAKPGYSNHQNGIALDLNTRGSSSSKGTGKVYDWLAKNGAQFGFKRIPAEHWHWEYRP